MATGSPSKELALSTRRAKVSPCLQVSYDEFTVCVLPKGVVVVWLTGGNQVLVGRYQAHKIQPTAADYKRYYGEANRAEFVKTCQGQMPAHVQAEIKAGALSTKKWDEYLQPYPWQVDFNVPFALRQYAFYGVNAERFTDPLTRDELTRVAPTPYHQLLLTPAPKPALRRLYVHGTAAHGGHYELRVSDFNEAETLAAFRALHVASPNSPITLLFTIDKPFQKVTITLQNEVKQIPLTKTPVQVFSED
jgi:hypothetical protein